jgi:hypothetical protein
MKNKLFLIQGLFFANDYIMGISHDPKIGERATINQAMFRTMFAGVIKFSENCPAGEGALLDHYGSSIIFEIELTDNKLSFKKRYDHRRDVILYELEKTDNCWMGSYSGNMVGMGAVKCQLLPVDEEFFMPTGLERFLEEE